MGHSEETDRLSLLWRCQGVQQEELGLDPTDLNAVEKRRTLSDLTLQLHEEVTELGRLGAGYKRHLLRTPGVSRAAVAEECADALKTLIAIAQLHGVTASELFTAFMTKTTVVSQRASAERVALNMDSKLLCVDLDDVVFDLTPFRELLGVNDDKHAMSRLVASERMKNEFYEGGGFRDLKPLPGAAEALQKFRFSGWQIVAITARPQWQYKRLYGDTIHSLEKHNIPFDLVLFNKDKVEALYEHVTPAWPVAFVEDMERNAKALAAAGVRVLLFDQPHNASVSATGMIERVKDWQQIMSLLGIGPTVEAAE